MCTCARLQSDTGLLTRDFRDFGKDGGHYNCHPVKCRTAKGPKQLQGRRRASAEQDGRSCTLRRRRDSGAADLLIKDQPLNGPRLINEAVRIEASGRNWSGGAGIQRSFSELESLEAEKPTTVMSALAVGHVEAVFSLF